MNQSSRPRKSLLIQTGRIGLLLMATLLLAGVLGARDVLSFYSVAASPEAPTSLTAPVPAPDAFSQRQAPRSLERVPLAAVPDKSKPTKLETRLQQLASAANSGSIVQAARAVSVTLKHGRVQVVLDTDARRTEEVGQRIADLGGVVETRYGTMLQAVLPPQQLESLAATDGVAFVRPPHQPQTQAVVSEGTQGMGLEGWHNTGFKGRGAKIAIVDLGFDSYQTLMGKELPPEVVARSFRTDEDISGEGNPHGTAAAEVVYDVAPEATLYLVNFSTEVELANAIDWLVEQNVHVISSSVGWPGTAYGDGRGSVNGLVQKAEAAGIVWVQAAGNYGETHWSGRFSDSDGNGFHNFSGSDEGNTVTLRRSRPNEERVFRVEVFLTWDDWDTLEQDYDLFLFKGESVVAQSTAFQNGTFPPLEHIVFTTASPGDYWISVQRFRANRRVNLDLVTTINYEQEYNVPAESLVIPADSPYALTVGAVEPGTLNLRPYSSQGPTKDGRPKPDLVAGDQVSTATYGPGAFPGTSAAVPYVAGAAGLIKSAQPSMPPHLVRLMLLGRAQGPGVAQRNNQLGAGSVFMGDLPGTLMLPMVVKQAPLANLP